MVIKSNLHVITHWKTVSKPLLKPKLPHDQGFADRVWAEVTDRISIPYHLLKLKWLPLVTTLSLFCGLEMMRTVRGSGGIHQLGCVYDLMGHACLSPCSSHCSLILYVYYAVLGFESSTSIMHARQDSSTGIISCPDSLYNSLPYTLTNTISMTHGLPVNWLRFIVEMTEWNWDQWKECTQCRWNLWEFCNTEGKLNPGKPCGRG